MACGSSVLANKHSPSLSDVCNLDMTLLPFDLPQSSKEDYTDGWQKRSNRGRQWETK